MSCGNFPLWGGGGRLLFHSEDPLGSGLPPPSGSWAGSPGLVRSAEILLENALYGPIFGGYDNLGYFAVIMQGYTHYVGKMRSKR